MTYAQDLGFDSARAESGSPRGNGIHGTRHTKNMGGPMGIRKPRELEKRFSGASRTPQTPVFYSETGRFERPYVPARRSDGAERSFISEPQRVFLELREHLKRPFSIVKRGFLNARMCPREDRMERNDRPYPSRLEFFWSRAVYLKRALSFGKRARLSALAFEKRVR